MKFKAKDFKKAVEQFQYSLPDEAEIEIQVREEDFEKGKLCDCFTLIATYEEKASSYDKNQKPYSIMVTVEMFPEHENRVPKATTMKSRDII